MRVFEKTVKNDRKEFYHAMDKLYKQKQGFYYDKNLQVTEEVDFSKNDEGWLSKELKA